jgi:hypothetical protein
MFSLGASKKIKRNKNTIVGELGKQASDGNNALYAFRPYRTPFPFKYHSREIAPLVELGNLLGKRTGVFFLFGHFWAPPKYKICIKRERISLEGLQNILVF